MIDKDHFTLPLTRSRLTKSQEGKMTIKLKAAVMAGAMSLALCGCATRDFVREQISAQDTRRNGVDAAQDGRLGQLDLATAQALERANDAHKLASGKFVYSIVLTDGSVTFRSGKSDLSEAAQAQLLSLVTELKNGNRNRFIEIQGHTDALGSEARNLQIGQDRAEAVRRYLNSQGVALNRMATISYGEMNPVASNATKGGRASNRRVTVIVME